MSSHPQTTPDRIIGVNQATTETTTRLKNRRHVGRDHSPDEFKEGSSKPERLPDGRVRLPGFLRLDQAEPWIGSLWKGQSQTVGGHVVEVLSYFPAAGEKVDIEGVEIEIERVENRVIASLLAKPTGAQQEEHRG